MQYTWKLNSIKKTTVGSLTDAVIQSYWTCTGTDEDGVTGEFNGATPFTPSDTNNDGFIDYKDLTEEIILDWVKAQVVDGYKDHIERRIQEQIAAKKIVIDEVKEEEFPWNSSPE